MPAGIVGKAVSPGRPPLFVKDSDLDSAAACSARRTECESAWLGRAEAGHFIEDVLDGVGGRIARVVADVDEGRAFRPRPRGISRPRVTGMVTGSRPPGRLQHNHDPAPRDFTRGLDRLDSEILSQVFGQGRPRVSAALSSLRSSEAEPLVGLRRSLARHESIVHMI